MVSGSALDASLLIIRLTLGAVIVAHGVNHVFGGGRIAGTASWFESMGMRPGILHARLASLTEIGGGLLLMLGLATPLGCAGVVGTMTVALVTAHLRNGFFIFRPGQGYEYVLVLSLTSIALGGLGAGKWSLDGAFGWFQPGGWAGLAVAAIAGLGGAACLLAGFWRPAR